MTSRSVPSPRPFLLLVDDDAQIRGLLREIGQRGGFEVAEAANGREALDALQRRHVDLMLLDLHMPEAGGFEVLRQARASRTSTQIVLMTGHSSIDNAVEAIKLGAAEFLPKPLDLPRVRRLMESVRAEFENRQAVLDNDAAIAERLECNGMIGRSPVMLELFSMVRRLAPHARTVLVSGETGTGKELVSRALHDLGPRRDKRYVTLNCSAVVETLFESELFGHVRGAFTGASQDKAGLFEAAHGGTLFLDEVGELPMPMQAKLLRTLENGEVQRVGAVDPRRVDVRVVAATNRSLDEEVAAGRFRSDLFYRLNVVEIPIPPLRERVEDIPYLTASFVRRFARDFGKSISGVTPEAEERLQQWTWPGNVRELKNVLERACLLCEGHLLTERDVQRALHDRQKAPAVKMAAPEPEDPQLPAPTETALREALDETGGNKSLAARKLGVSRRALYRLIEKYEEAPAASGS
ncbi:MAG: sigma-54-dependent Fis family transcriptional regulator [Acidobacteria bacterium]|nr:sigma-54-dependent Fis family transcriptional regulator [Acidobacteriota bacterium]